MPQPAPEPTGPPKPAARTWVNAERTIRVTLWPSDGLDVAWRPSPGHIWGPPERLVEDRSRVAKPDYDPRIDWPEWYGEGPY